MIASRTGITAVAARVELAPLASRPGLSVESGVRIPVGPDRDGGPDTPFLDWDDPFWNTRVFLDRPLAANVYAYLEAGTQLRWDRDADDFQLTTPLQVIVNFLPGRRWTVYVPLQAAPDWIGDPRGNYWSQTGLGLKFRPAPTLEVEALGTVFPLGRNAGAGSNVGVGVRLLR